MGSMKEHSYLSLWVKLTDLELKEPSSDGSLCMSVPLLEIGMQSCRLPETMIDMIMFKKGS